MIDVTVGVMALQGDFAAHLAALQSAEVRATPVRTVAELEKIDGLILPGGESTTMLRLLHVEGLFEPLQSFGRTKPIFGTCAGAILLASKVTNPAQESLELMDITVERNGYGRQIDSRIAQLVTEEGTAEAVFIRAPVIQRTGPEVLVLASYLGKPVLVREGRHFAATFHPELSSTSLIHRSFARHVIEHAQASEVR